MDTLGPFANPPAARPAWALCVLAAAVLAACGGADDQVAFREASTADTAEDGYENAPVDYGSGPVAASGAPMRQRMEKAAVAGAYALTYQPASGGLEASVKGAFGPAFAWPLIPLHLVMLPDGRIMSYGSDERGAQGATLFYAVWNPAWDPDVAGSGASPFEVLSNTTGTDIFCSTQLVMPQNGNVLLVGGDRTIGGVRNYAIKDINIFDPVAKTMVAQTPMAYRRWYATAVTTATGEQVIMGGRDDRDWAGSAGAPPTTATYAPTPELYTPGVGWRTLTGATSTAAFGAPSGNWWYPQGWLAPSGKVVTITHNGSLYSLDTAGSGTLTKLPGKLLFTNQNTSSAMFAPGKILSLRNGTSAQVVDLNGAQPVITNTAPASTVRRWGFATVLADGKVWVNGGSLNNNVMADAVYTTELWNPATGQWTQTPSTTKARMYHNATILLRSGAVLTGGGGAPGPVAQLNGEVYFPPYLFNADGSFATRPTITSVSSKSIVLGQTISVQVGSTTPISKVTLVRSGSATHSFNNEQRFKPVSFTQTGSTLQITPATLAAETPPGYYLLFVFNEQGVPSQAEILRLGV
jgi:Domain of unknown function (DUF1929)